MGSIDKQILTQLEIISHQLEPKPERVPFIDNETLSKASAVTSFGTTLEVAGQEFDQFIIQTDGNIDDISYKVKNLQGGFTEEIELSKFPYIPGPVDVIQFKNDSAESGKSIFVRKIRLGKLASPPIVPDEEVDPHIILGGSLQVPYSISKFTNPVFKTLSASLITTNNIGSFEFPEGTDYSVPTGKKLDVYRAIGLSAIVTELVLGYGDDGVAPGTTDPTNPVFVIGSNTTGTNLSSPLGLPTVGKSETFDIHFPVPAGKFPFGEFTLGASGSKFAVLFGVESDA